MQKQIRPDLIKKRLICCLCSAAIAITASGALATESHSGSSLSSFSFSERRFADEVKEYLGIPYRRGGSTKKGMDCSGFARTVYDRLLGINLPSSSADQFHSQELQKIDTRELQTGDLVFFGSSKKKRISHVGIYLSDGQFIHASSSEGVIVSSLSDRYWKKRYVGSKRHTALGSLDDLGESRSENLVQTQVEESSLLSVYASSSQPFSSPTSTAFALSAALYDPFADSTGSHYQEMAFTHNLSQSFDLSLSAFNHYTTSGYARAGLADEGGAYGLGETQVGASRQGITLSGDFRANDWLSFSPSISYFDDDNEGEPLDFQPRRSLGLATQLCSLDNSWSLSMLMHYNHGDSRDNATLFDSGVNSFDLAFKLGIALSDNMQLSIMSKYDKRPNGLSALDEASLDNKGGDFAMVFDFNY